MMSSGARVTLVQTRLPRYREPVFTALRETLSGRGIEFRLVHGQPTAAETLRGDEGALEWAQRVCNRYLRVGPATLVWQPLGGALKDADLVILTQENRLLSNYPQLLVGRGRRRVAFFGHGRNFQARRADSLAERFKRRVAHACDWWFAYTDVSRDWLVAQGYPAQRITSVDNAIDVDGLRADLAAAQAQGAVAELRARLGLPDGAVVGLYCGALYAEKRLDLLVAAGERVHARHAGFRLLVVGDGPLGAWLRAQAAARPWLHALGALYGVPKAAAFSLADVVLNPGLVGLHVLDAFAAGKPLVTTRDARHSPEIAYLEPGANGLVTEGTAEAYADAVCALIADADTRTRLAQAAAQAAGRYTVEHMAQRFATGIEQCLAEPPRRLARAVPA